MVYSKDDICSIWTASRGFIIVVWCTLYNPMPAVNGIRYLYGKMLSAIKWKENHFFPVFCD